MKLSDHIKQDSFASPAQKALLNVLVTHSWLTSELSATMNEHGVTLAQYNVLRILRGSHPERLTCSEVGQRLLERTPDVTRLLNRLEREDLISRRRAEHDGRCVEVGITPRGLDLINGMEDDVRATQERLTQHLSPDEHEALSNLLETMRTNQKVAG
ncbi:MAG: MarR family transcriptional regulator [Bacteroidetes bacterium QS_8_64_10]|jgi:DNA-binding MarR family transcriptional regulator|nr:MAG: MarR family transcriptional regulator [Bacteroidetes bacterium QS_8_64_10]